MLHGLDIMHQMITVSRCWPRDGSGLVGQAGWSISGVDLCRPQAHFWGQGKRDPITTSFLSSNHWASDQIADSLAITATYGQPTFFITFTCNPEWPEIQSQCSPGQDFHDIPVIVCHVFKQKLAHFECDLHAMFPNAGVVQYVIHSIEFQKRGLPHAHILLCYSKDCVLPDNIDSVILADNT